METVNIGYYLTTLGCKHHRPKLVRQFNSPKNIASVVQFLICPSCKRLGGMYFISQDKEESYSVPTSF